MTPSKQRREPGTIVTFYSYKGGTGRSMALANLAHLAAREVAPRRVLMIDWDLEAPGLNRYFPESEQAENADRPGLIDYFCQVAEMLTPEISEQISGRDGVRVLEGLIPLDDYIAREVGPSLDLIKAGRMDRDYSNRIASFDWVGLFRKNHRLYRAFGDQLTARYEWCFIDSRTGLSDTSGICTMLMPEKLVTVFTPNRQSLEGVINLAARAVEYRRTSDDPRPLSIFPLPSRIVTEEHKFLREAQDRYHKAFEECLQSAYDVNRCKLGAYFEEVGIPHKGFYGFNEMVALRDDPQATDVLSINRAYERFWRRLATLDSPWDALSKDEKAQEPTPPVAAPTGAGYLPNAGFENVFVSYAYADNLSLGGESEGFATRLQTALEVRLQQLLGDRAKVWRDTKLLGADRFSEETDAAISKAAVFVAVCSPAYLASAYCRKEMETFLRATREGQPLAGSRARLLRVDKTPTLRDDLPPELANFLGYAFFRVDEGGRAREFFQQDQEYYRRVDDLAHEIAEILRQMRTAKTGPGEASSRPAPTVYLAETASDVAPERDQLLRELRARGHEVLPAQALPLIAGDFARGVREEVAKADLSVHLVGGRRGVVPEGEERSIVELQFEIAMQIAKRCMVWIAPGSAQTELQRRLKHSSGPALEVVSARFQDFKDEVVQRLASLSRPVEAAPGVLPQIYLMYDERDLAAAQEVAAYLALKGIEVAHPLFGAASPAEIRQDRAESLQACDGVVILWGSGNEAWLRAMIRELRKTTGASGRQALPCAIYITPAADALSQQFSLPGFLTIRDGSPGDLDPLIGQLQRTVAP